MEVFDLTMNTWVYPKMNIVFRDTRQFTELFSYSKHGHLSYWDSYHRYANNCLPSPFWEVPLEGFKFAPTCPTNGVALEGAPPQSETVEDKKLNGTRTWSSTQILKAQCTYYIRYTWCIRIMCLPISHQSYYSSWFVFFFAAVQSPSHSIVFMLVYMLPLATKPQRTSIIAQTPYKNASWL